jgi:hypothetical protein
VLDIDGCLAQIMAIPGARRVTLVDCGNGLAIAAGGRDDLGDQHEDAARTTDVVRAVMGGPPSNAAGAGTEEIIISGTAGHHLITLIDPALVDAAYGGRLFLHLRLDRDTGNLALARLRIRLAIQEMAGSGHAE